MAPYNLFISHSWAYTDSYEKLTGLLDAKTNFKYRNYSVPKDDPIHNAGTDAQLTEAIKRKIQPTQVVVILAGVYATYSKWINKEIRIAKTGFQMPTPILGIQPWGAEKTSQKVKESADLIVGWNTGSIVDGIRELAN